jgi:hypothetical protein
MLSKTAAKRQAHRESSMHRQPGAAWTVTAISEPAKAYTLGHGLSFSGARRELAAWRFVRAVELSLYPLPDGNAVYQQLLSPFFPGVVFASATAEAAAALALAHARRVVAESSKTSASLAASEARGDSSLPGEKRGFGPA